MEGFFSALVMVLFFSSMAPIRKSIRDRGVRSKAAIALTGFSAPAWALLAIALAFYYDYAWSIPYVFLVIAWTVLVAVNIFISTYLYRYQALSALNAYGLGFGVLFSVIIDLSIFKSEFPFATLAAFCLFIVAGVIIGGERTSNRMFLTNKKVMLLLGFSALINVIFFSLYKIALAFQQHILMHVAISQVVLHGSLLLWGAKDINRYIKERRVKPYQIMLLCTFLILGVFAEGYALDKVPVSVIMVLGILPLSMFAIYDLQKKEFTLNSKTASALLCVALGLFLMV